MLWLNNYRLALSSREPSPLPLASTAGQAEHGRKAPPSTPAARNIAVLAALNISGGTEPEPEQVILQSAMTVGVLALQGDYHKHVEVLERLGQDHQLVREPADLEVVAALIIPGGESTTMNRLAERYGLWEPLGARLQAGLPVLGTCAGMIMLAREAEGGTRNFAQKTLGTMDLKVARNAYGAQVHSFEADVAIPVLGDEPLRAVFIRAPRILQHGSEVEVLARWEDEPVVVRQGNRLAASFHPELRRDDRLHQFWLRSCVR